MSPELQEMLLCPYTRSPFSLEVLERQGDAVEYGILRTRNNTYQRRGLGWKGEAGAERPLFPPPSSLFPRTEAPAGPPLFPLPSSLGRCSAGASSSVSRRAT